MKTAEEVKDIVRRIIFNPQIQNPPTSYEITDVSNAGKENYSSKYIDVCDFEAYQTRLCDELIRQLTNK